MRFETETGDFLEACRPVSLTYTTENSKETMAHTEAHTEVVLCPVSAHASIYRHECMLAHMYTLICTLVCVHTHIRTPYMLIQ